MDFHLFVYVYNSVKSWLVYSSLLLAYDAAAVKKFVGGSIDRQELSRWTIVRVIDFAHVFDAEGLRDDNFLTGLENLLTLFKASLNNRKWRLAVFGSQRKKRERRYLILCNKGKILNSRLSAAKSFFHFCKACFFSFLFDACLCLLMSLSNIVCIYIMCN